MQAWETYFSIFAADARSESVAWSWCLCFHMVLKDFRTWQLDLQLSDDIKCIKSIVK